MLDFRLLEGLQLFSPDYDRTAQLDATLEVTSDNELEELPIYILGLGDDQIEGSGGFWMIHLKFIMLIN